MPRSKVKFIAKQALLLQAHREIAHNMMRSTLVRIVNQAKRNTRNGFKTGRFVIDNSWRNISYQFSPVRGSGGQRIMGYVGSPDAHFMYWEMGHFNIYTRQYERNQWLRRSVQEITGTQANTMRQVAEETAEKYSKLLR